MTTGAETLATGGRFHKDPWSAYTHFAGFLAAIAGLVALIAYTTNDPVKLTTVTIYGGCMVLLFLASATYHFFDLGEQGNKRLRRLDHAAIFLMIAGSYVPSLVFLLEGAWRIAMLAVVGGLATLGVLFKLVFYNASRKAGVLMYVLLGWVILIPGHMMLPRLGAWELGWLIGGGLTYTVGAVVYARRWPDPLPQVFGHHEVWHLFVMGGAAMHYVYTMSLIDMTYAPW